MNVYVVHIDWGTIDGYPSRYQVDSVWHHRESADARAAACKNRTPYGALFVEVLEMTPGVVPFQILNEP